MQARLALAAMLIAVFPLPKAFAGLVISEVLYNEIGSDTNGEWLEIFNSGPAAIDLTNYKIGDEETSGASSATEGMFQFPAGATIPAGGVQLIAVQGSLFATQNGFKPDYEVVDSDPAIPNLSRYAAWDPDTGSNIINLSNSNDQALLLDGDDSIVDSLNWGNTFYFDPGLNAAAAGNGVSYERINALVDTDSAADWQLGTPASPGRVNVPEPTVAALVLIGLLSVAPRRYRFLSDCKLS